MHIKVHQMILMSAALKHLVSVTFKMTCGRLSQIMISSGNVSHSMIPALYVFHFCVLRCD